MKPILPLGSFRRVSIVAAAGLVIGGVVLAAPSTVLAQTIKLTIPPPPQSNVPSQIFTGTIKKFLDGETLQIARTNPDGKQSEEIVLVHLYGVSSVPVSSLPEPVAVKEEKKERGTVTSAVDLRQALLGRRVRVDVRGPAKLKNDQVAQNALVSLLPNEGAALSAPPSLSQQGAPTVAIVQSRPLQDAAGISRDLPRGANQPNLATSPNIPAPPPAGAVRKDDVLNYALVREGFARWNQTEAPGMKDFADAEKDAQKSRRGVWSVENKPSKL